ncbi:hypothetical protein HYH38_16155 [Clostridium botulinum]|uniref:hypothetical protein n=1 Tax=Clostridium botulinum TaxID=1491 RepID=UPI0013F1087B|nr:hypothetical protein [Clostridium botulinum]MBN1050333.1 hypothetical protein [Clostridium botulinum]MBY6810997.1 hypothetical protein [Clostridium botulinum]MBY6818474.1 hypothetical protein [Clostridium botulinum]MBY6824465.1 hypothetical protein [Clostridium botulinum]MBY6828768.1 hypothetical protein [Clostridium botulinum]
MNKKRAHLIMTDKQVDYIRSKASESNISMNMQIRNMLHEWYLKNKNRLDETDIDNIMNLNIELDDETERIYKLFIANMINNLIK